jgi:hypothetical protein
MYCVQDTCTNHLSQDLLHTLAIVEPLIETLLFSVITIFILWCIVSTLYKCYRRRSSTHKQDMLIVNETLTPVEREDEILWRAYINGETLTSPEARWCAEWQAQQQNKNQMRNINSDSQLRTIRVENEANKCIDSTSLPSNANVYSETPTLKM